MRLINVNTLALETFDADSTPPYAILSHTWGADQEEISFEDIQEGNNDKPGNGTKKLRECCRQAKQDDLEYAWIDTCCINKQSSRELDEAINSMFQWYKDAAVCYAYLVDVLHDDGHLNSSPNRGLSSSRWFRRGWTLQELLAPEELRFYDREWAFIGTKEDMAKDIEQITGISWYFLVGWEDFRQASAAQRMSWAAQRQTKRREDAAYCLLGIFGITMPMIYGEGDRAFIRLQEAIMKNTRDISILAWGLDPSVSFPDNPPAPLPDNAAEILSAGILASAASHFAKCTSIVPREQGMPHVSTFDISGGRLRGQLTLHTVSTGETYGLLNCGPGYAENTVVGIPIHKVSGLASNEYLRPQGRFPVLLPMSSTANSSAKYVNIHLERQSRARGERLWLHVDVHRSIHLKLHECYPPIRWEKGRAEIADAEARDVDGRLTRRSLARFRIHGEGSQDFVVILDFELHGMELRASSHMLTLSRGTTLELLSQRLIYMSPNVLGKQTARVDNVQVDVTVEQKRVAQEPIFFLKLVPSSGTSEISVDANLELSNVELKLEFVKALKKKEEARQRKDSVSGPGFKLPRHLDEFGSTQGESNWVEEILMVLFETGELDGESNTVTTSDTEGPRLPTMTKSLHNVGGHVPLMWATMNGYLDFAKLLLEKGTDIEVKDQSGKTSLLVAVERGHKAMVRLLLENGAQTEVKSQDGKTPLWIAAVNGYEEVAGQLLDKGANVKANNQNDCMPLLQTIKNGQEAMVRLLLERGAEIEAKDQKGFTPLIWATRGGREAIVRLLLEKGAEVEASDPHGLTPLLWTARAGREVIVRLLLEKGAKVEAKDQQGFTPLIWAAIGGREAIMRLLLEKGAEIEAKDQYGRTPLLCASIEGHMAVMELLLEKGAEIEAKDQYSRTPLVRASKNGHMAVTRLLLEKGAEIEAKDQHGGTALLWASKKEHMAVMRLLLEKGAEIEAKEQHGGTALLWASQSGHVAVVELLLEKGANIEATANNGFTPLLIATRNGRVAVVESLLEKGAEIDVQDPGRHTPLLWAAEFNYKKTVGILLAKGANIEARDVRGKTPLWVAAENGREAAVRVLLWKGADTEARDHQSLTPLLIAADRGHEEVVKLLSRQGAVIDANDPYKRTPAILAAWRGHAMVVQLLLERGANIEALEHHGKTALWVAAEHGREAVVRLLLQRGANVEVKEDNGKTSLWVAAKHGHLEVVKLLVDKGANIGAAAQDDGTTPVHWAAANGHLEVLQLLVDKGADISVTEKSGRTPENLAAASHHDNIVRYLASKRRAS